MFGGSKDRIFDELHDHVTMTRQTMNDPLLQDLKRFASVDKSYLEVVKALRSGLRQDDLHLKCCFLLKLIRDFQLYTLHHYSSRECKSVSCQNFGFKTTFS